MPLYSMVFLGWLKKTVEMGRHGASELMRNKNYKLWYQ